VELGLRSLNRLAVARASWPYEDVLVALCWLHGRLDCIFACCCTCCWRGPWLARNLWEWSRAYIKDPTGLPLNEYGAWNVSLLEDEDLAQEIHLHLQGIGQYVKAWICTYLDTPKWKLELKLRKTLEVLTPRVFAQIRARNCADSARTPCGIFWICQPKFAVHVESVRNFDQISGLHGISPSAS